MNRKTHHIHCPIAQPYFMPLYILMAIMLSRVKLHQTLGQSGTKTDS